MAFRVGVVFALGEAVLFRCFFWVAGWSLVSYHPALPLRNPNYSLALPAPRDEARVTYDRSEGLVRDKLESSINDLSKV